MRRGVEGNLNEEKRLYRTCLPVFVFLEKIDSSWHRGGVIFWAGKGRGVS